MSGSGQGLRGRPRALGAALIALGFAVTGGLALASSGCYHDDAIGHFLFARWEWHDPHYLVDGWGRPGLTWPLVLPAQVGLGCARLFMCALAALAAAATQVLAEVLFAPFCRRTSDGRQTAPGAECVRRGVPLAAASVVLLYLQPLWLLTAGACLTETAFAAYLTLALALAARSRPLAAAFVASLALVTRYEALALAPLLGFGLLADQGAWTLGRGPRWIVRAAAIGLLLAWAPLAHNVLGYWIDGRWPLAVLLEPKPTTHYGHGTPGSMALRLLVATGPAIGVLALLGAGRWLRRPGAGPGARTQRLVAALWLGWLLIHTALFWFGAYATGGYPRFFTAMAPLSAILALAGLESLRTERRRRSASALVFVIAAMALALAFEHRAPMPARWRELLLQGRSLLWTCAAVAALLGITLDLGPEPLRRGAARLLASLAVLATLLPLAVLVRPRQPNAEQRSVARAIAWLRHTPYAESPLVTTHIWAVYLLGGERNHIPPDHTPLLDQAPLGTVLLWDPGYSPGSRFGLTEAALAAHPSWRELWRDRAAASVGARLLVREPANAPSSPPPPFPPPPPRATRTEQTHMR